MKRKIRRLIAYVGVGSLLGCGIEEEFVPIVTSESTMSTIVTPTTKQLATYRFVNQTGETVTELYFYENGESKGQNIAGQGLEDGAMIEVLIEKEENLLDSFESTVEFTTLSGKTDSYETVQFETVTIALLSDDDRSGATPIEFRSE